MNNRSDTKPIKVVHFLSRFNVGGMENGVVNLCNRLDRKKFSPVICCLKGLGPMVERLRKDVEVYNLDCREGKDLFRPFKVAKLFLKIKPDIVHTHGWGQCSFDGIMGARLACVPIVINGEHGGFSLKRYQVLLQRFLASSCDLVLAVSESLKNEIVGNLSINSSKIFVIRNGVDTYRFNGKHSTIALERELRNLFQIENSLDKCFIIGCIASLKPEKNQVFLLEAIRKLNRVWPGNHLKLLLVGEGQDRMKLEHYLRTNSMEKQVILMGNRGDIPQILSLLKVLVSTSLPYWEGLSNVTLEALSSGVPVIATRSIGVQELIHDDCNGYLFENGDFDGFVNKLILLMKNPEILSKLSAHAITLVGRDFSIERMIADYETCYISMYRKFKCK